MSTLKVSAINNAAAGSGGLVLAADGNVSGAGMDLIVSQSFSAVSSVSVDDCFTTAYDNYKIVVSGMTYAATSLSTKTQLRFRASGVDATSADYHWGRLVGGSVDAGGASNTDTSFQLGDGVAPVTSAITFDCITPALSMSTFFLSHAYVSEVSNTSIYVQDAAGRVNLSTAYDGFTLIVGNSTFTGTLRVYGYRN